MPCGVKLTRATVAPGMANILLNAVLARTRLLLPGEGWLPDRPHPTEGTARARLW